MSPTRQNSAAVKRAERQRRALMIDMLVGDPDVWRYIAEQADEIWPQLPDGTQERENFADLASIGHRLAEQGDRARLEGEATHA